MTQHAIDTQYHDSSQAVGVTTYSSSENGSSPSLQVGVCQALQGSINALLSTPQPTATATAAPTETASTDTASTAWATVEEEWPVDTIPYDLENNLNPVPTGNPLEDLTTLYEGLLIMQSCSGGAWEVEWLFEFIAGLAVAYEDASGDVTNQDIEDFFASDGAQTLETSLVDEIMMNYYAYCVIDEGQDASTAAASTAAFAQDLEAALASMGIDSSDPIAGAMYTELTAWDDTSEVTGQMSSYWVDDPDGSSTDEVFAITITTTDSDGTTGTETVYLTGDDALPASDAYVVFEEYSNNAFYDSTFATGMPSADCTDELLNDILYMPMGSWQATNVAFSTIIVQLEMELYSFAYTLSFLNYETEEIDSLISMFDTDDEFATVTTDSDGNDVYTSDADQQANAMEFMDEFYMICLNAQASQIGQETGLAETMTDIWDTLGALSYGNSTIGGMYAVGGSEELAEALGYYQNEDASAITDLLNEMSSACSDLSSYTTTMVSITASIFQSALTAWNNYDNDTTSGTMAVTSTAVSNMS